MSLSIFVLFYQKFEFSQKINLICAEDGGRTLGQFLVILLKLAQDPILLHIPEEVTDVYDSCYSTLSDECLVLAYTHTENMQNLLYNIKVPKWKYWGRQLLVVKWGCMPSWYRVLIDWHLHKIQRFKTKLTHYFLISLLLCSSLLTMILKFSGFFCKTWYNEVLDATFLSLNTSVLLLKLKFH